MRTTILISAAFALSFTSGCTETPAPIPAGGWTVSFSRTGASCNVPTHNQVLGEVSQDGKTKLVSDGINNATVSCSVTPKSGGFAVQGSALQNGSNLQISIATIDAKATADKPAKGTVGYISSTTGDPFKSTSESPCDFFFVPDTDEGIGAGKIWVAFRCPVVTADMASCAINQSYVKFENCEGATDEEEE